MVYRVHSAIVMMAILAILSPMTSAEYTCKTSNFTEQETELAIFSLARIGKSANRFYYPMVYNPYDYYEFYNSCNLPGYYPNATDFNFKLHAFCKEEIKKTEYRDKAKYLITVSIDRPEACNWADNPDRLKLRITTTATECYNLSNSEPSNIYVYPWAVKDLIFRPEQIPQDWECPEGTEEVDYSFSPHFGVNIPLARELSKWAIRAFAYMWYTDRVESGKSLPFDYPAEIGPPVRRRFCRTPDNKKLVGYVKIGVYKYPLDLEEDVDPVFDYQHYYYFEATKLAAHKASCQYPNVEFFRVLES